VASNVSPFFSLLTILARNLGSYFVSTAGLELLASMVAGRSGLPDLQNLVGLAFKVR